MIGIREYRLMIATSALLLLTAAALTVGKPLAQSLVHETSRKAGFVLSGLTVSGNQRTERNDILALLDIDAGMPLMAIDLNQLQKRIEALPWVRRAIVTRVLPGDINIEIEERVPFALWQRDGKLRLIDESGVVITRHGLASFAGLLMIVGEDGPASIGPLQEILFSAPALHARIKTVVRVGQRRWDILFDNGIRVKLPDNSDFSYDSAAAWKKFVDLEGKHHLLAREISVIDMRIADRLILRVTPTGRRMMDGKEWAT